MNRGTFLFNNADLAAGAVLAPAFSFAQTTGGGSDPLQAAVAAAVKGCVPKNFLWGAASAAYQVEGSTRADGKGVDVWDYWLSELNLANDAATGEVAINFYDRNQYLKDIELFKQMGLNSYRFSVSWTRIIPDGVGPVNPAGIAHYRQFILNLQAAGIQPLLTLYHWEMPKNLALDGGWENRSIIDHYARYAEVLFDHFHDLVENFALVNEPSVEFAMKQTAKQRLADPNLVKTKAQLAFLPNQQNFAAAMKSFNHLLLACAKAQTVFRQKGYKGRLGIALPYFHTLTAADNPKTTYAAQLLDGLFNRWFLDAMYKGSYPQDVLDFAAKHKLDSGVQPEDAATIHAARFGYLGVNYYAPLYVKQPENSQWEFDPELTLPEGGGKIAFNGEVRPDIFYAMFMRLKNDYGNPPVIVTENGVGFPNEDNLENGKVHDQSRAQYIADHIAAMKRAIAEGADIQGYHAWSSHDNLEWFSGYASRFGMIYVDYNTQKRYPKDSAALYAEIIKQHRAKG